MTVPADGDLPGLRSVPPGGAVISSRRGLDFAAAPVLHEHLINVLRRSIDRPILGLLGAAVGVTVATVQAMVLDGSGCSQTSFSCHSACEF